MIMKATKATLTLKTVISASSALSPLYYNDGYFTYLPLSIYLMMICENVEE